MASFDYLRKDKLRRGSITKKSDTNKMEDEENVKVTTKRRKTSVQENNKKHQHFIETCIYWLTACINLSDMVVFQDIFITILPHIIKAQHHSDVECAALAKHC